MPSASSSVSSGEPTVSSTTNVGRSRRQVRKWRRSERLHALHERLLRAGRDEQHAQALGRRSRSVRASPISAATPVRLSLAPATALREPISAIVAAEPERDRGARAASARLPGERAERDEQRAAEDAGPSAAASCRCARAGPESARRRTRGRCGSKSSAPVRGVMVGDEDDRALRVRVAGRRRRRSTSARGEDGAAEPQAPARHVVGDGRRRRAADERAQPAAAAQSGDPGRGGGRPSGHQ